MLVLTFQIYNTLKTKPFQFIFILIPEKTLENFVKSFSYIVSTSPHPIFFLFEIILDTLVRLHFILRIKTMDIVFIYSYSLCLFHPRTTNSFPGYKSFLKPFKSYTHFLFWDTYLLYLTKTEMDFIIYSAVSCKNIFVFQT